MNKRSHCNQNLLFDVRVYCCCDDDDDPDECFSAPRTLCHCCDCCNYNCDLSVTPQQPSPESFVRQPCSSACGSRAQSESVEAVVSPTSSPTTFPCIVDSDEMPLNTSRTIVGETTGKQLNAIKKSNTHGTSFTIQGSQNIKQNRATAETKAAPGNISSNKRLPPIGKAHSIGKEIWENVCFWIYFNFSFHKKTYAKLPVCRQYYM